MGAKNLINTFAIIFLGVSIMVSGYCISNSIKSIDEGDTKAETLDTKVLNLSEVAVYLNMPEEEVRHHPFGGFN